MANLEAIRDMRVDRVARPRAFVGTRGGSDIQAFFVSFARYTKSVYKEDKCSWLQVLPSFLDGEARLMVKAFGRGVEYGTVMQRLIDEFTSRTTLGTNDCFYFFAATRHSGESLACFSVRLESLAGMVSGINEGSRDMLVRSKVLSSLPRVF